MKQTAVEWLANEIEGLDTGVSYHFFQEMLEQAKEMEKQQMIDFAIGFAEWLNYKNYRAYSNGWANFETKAMTTKELLKIYKNEKGL